MSNYRFLKNAFWEKEDRSQLKCIRMTKLGPNQEKKDELSLKKYNEDGSENKLFREVVDTLTIKGIDKSSNERKEQKKRSSLDNKVKEYQKRKAKELERLYGFKLRAFEIEDVKNCSNRLIRSKIRKAKNEIEVQSLVTIAIAHEMGLQLINQVDD